MDASITILLIMLIYFGVLYVISHVVSRKGTDNSTFFLGNRKSPWWVVALAMVSSSISSITFVSVPGMVGTEDMTYMQMVFGFFFGYLVIAFVLLPLYYKLNLTTIYGYLKERFGMASYRTGAMFFILSKMLGSATRLYMAVMILQVLVFSKWNIPFWLTVSSVVFLIWAYTRRSGIKTIIWTDLLQTFSMLTMLILIIWQVMQKLDMNAVDMVEAVRASEHSRMLVFDDWSSRQNFFKQFFSGMFITIVMTGLDQGMMQKNLSCKNLKDARKNVLSYSLAFAPINLLLLSLGILLLLFSQKEGISLPAVADQIMPTLAAEHLGFPVLVFFTIGIVALSFSSADSALAALTTSVCVDLLGVEKKKEEDAKRMRNIVHFLVSAFFVLIILLIEALQQDSLIVIIFKLASYTYGPLLGLFALGLFTKIRVKDSYTPIVCIVAPLLCLLLEYYLNYEYAYKVGYEILMVNALLTMLGLLFITTKRKTIAN